jgi:UDP-N-acetyl-D-galactosamine dehydrogenase
MADKNNIEDTKVAVIGLGYVGLPLAVEFGKSFKTLGFDISEARIAELKAGRDSTLEVSAEEFAEAKHFSCTSNLDDLDACDVYIVTVPTPIDSAKRPDLGALRSASRSVGKVLSV